MAPTINTMPLVDRLPESWEPRALENTFWICCYRVVFADPNRLDATGASAVELDGALLLVTYGSVFYRYIAPITIASSTPDRRLDFAPLEQDDRTLDEAVYLRIVMPYATAEGPADDEVIQRRTEEIVGMATVHLGQCAVFDQLFINVFSFAENTIATSLVFKTPDGRGPEIGQAALDELAEAERSMHLLDQGLRSQLELGLRWYGSSFGQKGDVDSLLAAWFAIEAIGMSTENVRDLHVHLAAAYGISEDAARREFQLGKIHGLRGDIVHRGERPPIHADLLAYLQAVFVDVFRHRVRRPSWRLARAAINSATESPSKWFPHDEAPTPGA